MKLWNLFRRRKAARPAAMARERIERAHRELRAAYLTLETQQKRGPVEPVKAVEMLLLKHEMAAIDVTLGAVLGGDEQAVMAFNHALALAGKINAVAAHETN
jgi:hypothetical protein